MLQKTLFCFVSSFFCVTSVSAYNRSKTPQGHELFWDKVPVSFYIQTAGSPDLKQEQTYKSIQQGFKSWTAPSCTCLRFSLLGLTEDSQLGYDQSNPSANKNLVIFQRSNWEHARSAVAVTSTIFQQKTGQIVAFDMEMNNQNFKFSLNGKHLGKHATIDLENTIAHEAGHVLGLDHSEVRSATMYVSAPPGETQKRTLHTDDIEGVCAIYSLQGDTCSIARSQAALNSGCGCQTQPHSLFLSLRSLLFLFLLVFSSLFLQRRLQKAKQTSST